MPACLDLMTTELVDPRDPLLDRADAAGVVARAATHLHQDVGAIHLQLVWVSLEEGVLVFARHRNLPQFLFGNRPKMMIAFEPYAAEV
jgi:hypothetical protein